MPGYNQYETEGKPLKLWDTHEAFDTSAMEQLHNLAKLPFIHEHVAGMPDVHYGIGATVGSVIATKGAIVPAAVGVDIGCGMMAVQTTLKAEQLPDNLKELRNKIEIAVPHGKSFGRTNRDKGSWKNIPAHIVPIWQKLEPEYLQIIEKHPKAKTSNRGCHLGTLGTGNHFIEICLDEKDFVWVMLHSGSRGVGNQIGTYFIEKAKEEIQKYFMGDLLPDKDLAYLVEHSEIFTDYMSAVGWAQDFALENRKLMMDAVLRVMKTLLPAFVITEMAVNCHHNYVAREHHFGADVLVTRKGAVRARKGDLGIIPGSMGTGSFIVEGLGNADSFCSCSHGAGRKMSRTEAKKVISLEEHRQAMQGIEARLDKDVLDESPAAYKDIGDVMKAQEDLVRILHRLRQIVNVKG